MAQVRELDVSWCGIEEAGAVQLGVALRVNRSLTSLHAAHNRIEASGAVVLTDGLAHNHSLTSLDLSHNPIGDLGVQSLMARAGRPGRHLTLGRPPPTVRRVPTATRPMLNEAALGGHYCVNLARPYGARAPCLPAPTQPGLLASGAGSPSARE